MKDKPDLFDIVEEEWQRKEREQEGATQLPPCCDYRDHSDFLSCFCTNHPRSGDHPFGTL